MSLENSLYRVEPKPFHKSIEVPSSKSYSNRALVVGAILGNNFKVKNISLSTDVLNLLSVFEKIGLIFSINNSEVEFLNSFPSCEIESSSPVTLLTGDGGTTNRFLIPMLALGKNEYQLRPSEKMGERPMDEFYTPLKELGCEVRINQADVWFSIKGPLRKTDKEIVIDCSKSSQFATALKLATFKLNLNIKLINLFSSEDYLKMTEEVINKCLKDNFFYVPVDYSSLSYPAVLGAITGNVEILNCKERDWFQADSYLLDVFSEIGVSFLFEDKLIVKKSKLNKGIVCDGSKCPDLIMTLAVLASKIPYESHLNNLEVLKHKESNRIEGIMKILDAFNVKYIFDSEKCNLKIIGNQSNCSWVDLEVERDHRMVMMGYLMMRINSGGSINNIDCVNKSFTGFFEVME